MLEMNDDLKAFRVIQDLTQEDLAKNRKLRRQITLLTEKGTFYQSLTLALRMAVFF